jgi:predicted nuclease of predicted toxin-antitoxin system
VIPLLADQNFNEHIIDGLMRRLSTLDVVLAREVDLSEAQDPVVLQWAAMQGRVLLTHDRRTVPAFARSRVETGLPMPGIFLVSDDMPVGRAIEELLVAVQCLSKEECDGIIRFFPL